MREVVDVPVRLLEDVAVCDIDVVAVLVSVLDCDDVCVLVAEFVVDPVAVAVFSPVGVELGPAVPLRVVADELEPVPVCVLVGKPLRDAVGNPDDDDEAVTAGVLLLVAETDGGIESELVGVCAALLVCELVIDVDDEPVVRDVSVWERDGVIVGEPVPDSLALADCDVEIDADSDSLLLADADALAEKESSNEPDAVGSTEMVAVESTVHDSVGVVAFPAMRRPSRPPTLVPLVSPPPVNTAHGDDSDFKDRLLASNTLVVAANSRSARA